MMRIIRADRFEDMRLRMEAEDAALHNAVVREVRGETPAGVIAELTDGYACKEHGTHHGLVFDGPQSSAIEAVLRLYCPRDPATLDGAEIIAAERKRQIEQEGWSEEHDDTHKRGQLALAASCYALPPYERGRALDWPWDRKWWKPTPDDRIRELAKAGALIAAEIDRLKRLASTEGP